MRRLWWWTGVVAAATAAACSHPAVKTGATLSHEKTRATTSAGANEGRNRLDRDVDIKQLWIIPQPLPAASQANP